MGNTPSSPQGGTPTTGNTSSNTNQASSSTAAAPPTSSSSRPIPPTSTPAAPTTSGPSVIHSGLTPPPRSPSPPCPPTPALLPYGGHLSPQNPHALSLTQAHDYSKTVVTALIMEARLAPFYRGLEDYEEDFTEEDIGRLLTELREKDFNEGVANSVTEAMKAEREPHGGVGSITKKIGIHRAKEHRLEEEKAERDKRERRAYLGAVECPICFLNYPSNINTSRCCQQPICTECFVQIKRGEATLTHLESEPACCPFCVETDFGVIYERPNVPIASTSALASQSALSISPEPESSGFSQGINLGGQEAELDVGIGMAPKAQESVRRKSVSSKSKEVVTIDEIRPDWEDKLNAVKAAAARKASRRIVMRQVGDRLVPIGFTSARAPGQADFSMSVGQTNASSAAGSGSGSPSGRDRRRGSGRERDLEELMIMEAMRLSLLDHEEHQRKQTDSNTASNANNTGPIIQQERAQERAPDKRKFSLSVPGHSGSGPSSRRASDTAAFQPEHKKSGSTASKIFSKFSGNRSRANSSASSVKSVSFSSSTTNLAGPSRVPASPRHASPSPPLPVQSPPSSLSRSPPSSLSPTTTAPAITTLADHTSVQALSPVPATSGKLVNAPPVAPIGLPTPIDEVPREPPQGLPRISLDMQPLAPDSSASRKLGSDHVATHQERVPLQRNDTDVSDAPTERPNYARLDSEGM